MCLDDIKVLALPSPQTWISSICWEPSNSSLLVTLQYRVNCCALHVSYCATEY